MDFPKPGADLGQQPADWDLPWETSQVRLGTFVASAEGMCLVYIYSLKEDMEELRCWWIEITGTWIFLDEF